jgi:hypothetical protein
MPFLSRSGVRLRYEQYGSGRALIFLHPIGGRLEDMRSLVGALYRSAVFTDAIRADDFSSSVAALGFFGMS